MSHRNTGTGNWKGKRDKHEKKQRNSAKDKPNWQDQGKHTNSERNKSRKSDGSLISEMIDQIFGK